MEMINAKVFSHTLKYLEKHHIIVRNLTLETITCIHMQLVCKQRNYTHVFRGYVCLFKMLPMAFVTMNMFFLRIVNLTRFQ